LSGRPLTGQEADTGEPDLVQAPPLPAGGDQPRGLALLRFTLSLRDVEDLLAERGIEVSYETVRSWTRKFGRAFARNLRRSRPRPTATWHLDEMVVRIGGERMFLWRAVDSEGEVLDMLVQKRRNPGGGGKALAQAAPRARDPARGDHHRRAELIRGRNQGARPLASPPPRSASREQPGGELAPAATKTRAGRPTVQVARLRPAVRFNSCRGLQRLQRPASPDLPPNAAPLSARSVEHVADRDCRGLMKLPALPPSSSQPLTW
jgi:hypothetical protein